MIRLCLGGLLLVLRGLSGAVAAGPDCSRPFTLALHDHGLLYSADTDTGIDKDFADELIRRIFEKYFKPDLAAAMVDFQVPP